MTSQSRIRTFIAIEISDSLREKIANLQENLKKEKERISWTKPGNIHLTLKFLGDVQEEKIDSIGESLTTSTQEFQSFSFSVKDLGAFPNLRRARVLWLSIENPSGELSDIQNRVEKNLNQLGFPRGKKQFNPHLTIGRVKSQLSNGFIEKFNATTFEEEKVKVEDIILMKSELHPKGAIYTPLKKISLQRN